VATFTAFSDRGCIRGGTRFSRTFVEGVNSSIQLAKGDFPDGDNLGGDSLSHGFLCGAVCGRSTLSLDVAGLVMPCHKLRIFVDDAKVALHRSVRNCAYDLEYIGRLRSEQIGCMESGV
jgi:hypothetical protein